MTPFPSVRRLNRLLLIEALAKHLSKAMATNGGPEKPVGGNKNPRDETIAKAVVAVVAGGIAWSLQIAVIGRPHEGRLLAKIWPTGWGARAQHRACAESERATDEEIAPRLLQPRILLLLSHLEPLYS